MKQYSILIVALIVSLSPLRMLAQDTDGGAKYRIVAVSHSIDSVVSVSNEVELFKDFSLQVPTAFTPNSDGLNDNFGAVAENVKEYKLVVYNRYGEVVFNTDNLSEKWDGTYNGSKVPAGGYMYEIVARSHEDENLQKSGKVLVII